MSKKSHSKQPKTKPITKETVIIAGLICFILGYATHSLVVSYNNFGSTPPQQISSQNFNNQQQTAAPAPQQAQPAEDSALLNKVEENPNDLGSWIQLGNLYFDTGNIEPAINAYTKALEIDPNNANVQTDLGIMYRRFGKIAEAIKAFNMARTIDPTHQMSLFNKGIVFYYDMGNAEGALETWNKLLRANPDFLMPNGQRLFDFLKSLN